MITFSGIDSGLRCPAEILGESCAAQGNASLMPWLLSSNAVSDVKEVSRKYVDHAATRAAGRVFNL